MNQNASLIEALQALAAKMAKAASEAEAEAGLKQLRQIRADFLGREKGESAVNAARRNAEALIAWLETRLEQLKLQLARKRRAQEGEVMEQLAQQREAEGPSLLPTELVDAVVRSTNAADPEEPSSTAPKAEPAKPEKPGAQKQPEAEKEKQTGRQPEKKPAEKQPEEKPAERQADELHPAEAQPVRQAEPAPEAPARKREKPEWSRSERLAAHLAASVREDPGFFEKLRAAAKRAGPAQKHELDEQTAEAHYRTLRDLGRRLVNLELHAKAIARAKERQEPVSPLLRIASKELKRFMREFKAAGEARPELAGEYERRFGGWAAQFAAMKPEKGSAILEQCRAERRPEEPAREKEPEREADAPQLVLKREDHWQQ